MFSGASLGADMAILPAMYAKHISNSDFDSSVAFGIWNFFNKSTFALSVGIILPGLAATGFAIGRTEPNTNLMSLTIFYSIIPCLLKLLALLTLNFGPFERKLN
jgi:GPH family glycoside/pentoside/hexuronide:cation symporter